ncbi:hypothetical protein OAK42_01270 [Candidatus Poseidoniaceae archaeon]|nr:hypothetical protein [Candidatus Poseidoniaceae archaeon]
MKTCRPACVLWTTGDTSSWYVWLMCLHISSNVLVPLQSSQSTLFLSSNGLRNSLGARKSFAAMFSIRPNFFSNRRMMVFPVTPSTSGCDLDGTILVRSMLETTT